jgi:hypothetical protein
MIITILWPLFPHCNIHESVFSLNSYLEAENVGTKMQQTSRTKNAKKEKEQ